MAGLRCARLPNRCGNRRRVNTQVPGFPEQRTLTVYFDSTIEEAKIK